MMLPSMCVMEGLMMIDLYSLEPVGIIGILILALLCGRLYWRWRVSRRRFSEVWTEQAQWRGTETIRHYIAEHERRHLTSSPSRTGT